MYHVRIIIGDNIEHYMFWEKPDSDKERELIGGRDCWIDIERVPLEEDEDEL